MIRVMWDSAEALIFKALEWQASFYGEQLWSRVVTHKTMLQPCCYWNWILTKTLEGTIHDICKGQLQFRTSSIRWNSYWKPVFLHHVASNPYVEKTSPYLFRWFSASRCKHAMSLAWHKSLQLLILIGAYNIHQHLLFAMNSAAHPELLFTIYPWFTMYDICWHSPSATRHGSLPWFCTFCTVGITARGLSFTSNVWRFSKLIRIQCQSMET